MPDEHCQRLGMMVAFTEFDATWQLCGAAKTRDMANLTPRKSLL
jgi:hypothetical protein